MTDLLYKEITYDIRGACFDVWKAFAGAFKEKVVERAMVIELKKRNRKVETQKRIPIFYGNENVGYYIPDAIIDDSVLVEIKTKEFITSQDYDQFWKYLKGSEYKVGLLINFGPKELEFKRVVYDNAREKVFASIPRGNPRRSAEQGFTLMEIIVATTIFAIVSTAMMALFNYTLIINRKSDALRQATQGMRNTIEFLTKEIRNGKIDYGVEKGIKPENPSVGPCAIPVFTGTPPASYTDVQPTYVSENNRLGLTNSEGDRECIYLASGPGAGTYVGAAFKSDAINNPNPSLVLEKLNSTDQPNTIKEVLNPKNVRIDQLKFFVRPLKDPYTSLGGYEKVQPFVTMNIAFVAKLPTGEEVPIYYQTTVSTNKYDIPN